MSRGVRQWVAEAAGAVLVVVAVTGWAVALGLVIAGHETASLIVGAVWLAAAIPTAAMFHDAIGTE
jgi:hypothetical protein